jgi:hypothetical protein
MEISRELFEEQRRPRFGRDNPERMNLAFWEWMVRGYFVPPKREVGENPLFDFGMMMREGKLKSQYGPRRARDHFQIPLNRDDGPIWTFERMGRAEITLRDGRIVCIAGEHEDYYDPDFYIYNDVIVLGPGNRVEIYGYPAEIFSPTDFHTATLVGDRILLIGSVGYPKDRRPGQTPVYSLDGSNYAISAIPTSGESPGWISHHSAEYDGKGLLTIRGGQVYEGGDGTLPFRSNVEEYALDLETGVWRRTTNRDWPQFLIRAEERGTKGTFRTFFLDDRLLTGIEYAVRDPSNFRERAIVVQGVVISFRDHVRAVELIIEGSLPEGLTRDVLEQLRLKAEKALGSPCVLEARQRRSTIPRPSSASGSAS